MNQTDNIPQHTSQIGFKSVAKYALLPGIIPLIKRLVGKFAEFLHMFTLVFGTVGLIDKNHPCMRPENIGRYRFVDIIGLAAHNVVFDRKHLPQTIMFFAVVLSVIFCIAMVVTTILYSTVFISDAHAQFYSPPTGGGYTRQSDWALIFLQNVFGKTGIGGLIWTLSDTDPGNGTSRLQAMFRGMMSHYSMGLLILATFQVIYIIVVTLIEAAQTGKPFGQKFNNVWAPIRLALAIGLMVPISAGYNGAQMVVFQMADWGSNLGTNVWIAGLNQLKNNGNDNFLQATMPDRGYRFIRGLWLSEVCMAAWNYHNQLGLNSQAQMTLRNEGVGLMGTNAIVAQRQALIDSADQVIPSDDLIGDNVYFEVRYGTKVDPTYCGSFRVPVKQGAVKIKNDKGQDVLLNSFGMNISEQYGKIFSALQADMRKTAEYYVIKINNNCNYMEVPTTEDKHFLWIFQTYWQKIGFPLSQYTGERKTQKIVDLTGSTNSVKYAHFLESTAEVNYPVEIQKTNDAVMQLVKNASRGGWASAGSFFMTISYANGALHNAVSAIPTVVQLPKPLAGPDFSPNDPSITDKIEKNSFLEFLFGGASKDRRVSIQKTYKNLKEADAWFAQAPTRNSYMMSWLGEPFRTFVVDDQQRMSSQNSNDISVDQKIRPLVFDSIMSISDGDVNPLGRLVTLGGRFISIALTLYGLGVAASIILTGGSTALGSLFLSIGTLFGTAGFALTLYLPMLPFIYFMFAVIEWVMGVLEAVIGMPLWAMSMITVEGDGIGRQAQQNFMKLIGIMLQPAVTVIALIASFIMFSASITFFNYAFEAFTNSYAGTAGGGGSNMIQKFEAFGSNMVGLVGFTFLYAFACYSIGQSCFKLISRLSDEFVSWIGAPKSFSGVMDAGLAGYNRYVAMGQFKELQSGVSGAIKGQVDDYKKNAKDSKDAANQNKAMMNAFEQMSPEEKSQFQNADGSFDSEKYAKHYKQYNTDQAYRDGWRNKYNTAMHPQYSGPRNDQPEGFISIDDDSNLPPYTPNPEFADADYITKMTGEDPGFRDRPPSPPVPPANPEFVDQDIIPKMTGEDPDFRTPPSPPPANPEFADQDAIAKMTAEPAGFRQNLESDVKKLKDLQQELRDLAGKENGDQSDEFTQKLAEYKAQTGDHDYTKDFDSGAANNYLKYKKLSDEYKDFIENLLNPKS